MIKFELITLECMTSHINWKDKKITLNHNIKYINVNMKHIKHTDKHNFIEIKESYTKSYIYSDITKYWLSHINNKCNEYCNIYNIDFTILKLDVDYCLAPLYVSRTNLHIGIFILNSEYIEKINNDENVTISKYGFLSIVKPIVNINITKPCDSNKYNIVNGMIHNTNYDTIHGTSTFNLDTNISVPLIYILKNIRNYLPKLEIIRDTKNMFNPKIFKTFVKKNKK